MCSVSSKGRTAPSIRAFEQRYCVGHVKDDRPPSKRVDDAIKWQRAATRLREAQWWPTQSIGAGCYWWCIRSPNCNLITLAIIVTNCKAKQMRSSQWNRLTGYSVGPITELHIPVR